MKKLLLFAAVFLALFTNAQAKPGDKAGYIYATDIRTYINGIEVPSYNIGGKTVIIAEDTIADCTYSEQLRTLFINPIDKYNIIGGSNASSRKSGTIVGRTYETDIKAYMFDSRIPSYNIGGKTAVAIEDIGDSGEFSDFGARYFYYDTARTLNAEFMCDTRDELFAVLKEKHASVNIDENFASLSYSGNKHFDNVEIDKEKEIVKFHYAGDYIIDLKTGMMTKAL